MIKTILGKSFAEYGLKGDSVNIGTTVSYRGIASKYEEVSLANHWTANLYKLAVTDNFNKGLIINKAETKNISGIDAYGLSYITELMMCLPFNLAVPAVKLLSSRLTLQFSAVPGPIEPYDWDGIKLTKISGFLPEFLGLSNSIFAWPVGNNLNLSLWTNKKNIKEPEKLMALFNKNLNEFIQEDPENTT